MVSSLSLKSKSATNVNISLRDVEHVAKNRMSLSHTVYEACFIVMVARLSGHGVYRVGKSCGIRNHIPSNDEKEQSRFRLFKSIWQVRNMLNCVFV